MLVYCKEPMGYTQIDNFRVYGKYYAQGSFGPTDLPWKLFRKHRDKLEEATYTKEFLEAKFGGTFPDVRFKSSELRFLEIDDLIAVANGVGVQYRKRRGKMDGPQKKILCRHIRFRL